MSWDKDSLSRVMRSPSAGNGLGLGIVILLYLLLAAVIAFHIFVLRIQISVPLLFMLCVVLAAWLLRPVSTAVYAAFALAGLTFHAWLESIPVLDWLLDFLTVSVTAGLSVWIAYESRKQTALAEENARIAEESAKDARRLAILAKASQLFTSSIELESVLQSVVEEIGKEIGNLAALWLFNEKSKELVLETVFTSDPAVRKKAEPILSRLSLDVGVTGVVARTGRPMLVPDARSPEITGGMRLIIDALNARSVLSVPLLYRGKMIGVMTAATLGNGRAYNNDDLVLAEELAALAATSIANAQLYANQETLVVELQESRHEREQFLGMITHEIAGMLTVVSGYTQLALKDAKRDNTLNQKALLAIQSQTKRLTRLVFDLRDISRIERGKFELNLTQCDIGSMVRSTVDEQQALTSDHTIVLETQPEPVTGLWDCDRLSQAVSNLIRNAVNYSPPNKSIWVTVSCSNGNAQISVRDEGVGIDQADVPRLFKPYERLEHTRHIKGTGLGLYISKAIVEAHHGTIEVNSALGQGSIFTIHLPTNAEKS